MKGNENGKDFSDRAGDIRPGEELDVVRLGAYLREHLPAGVGGITIAQFPSGHSNLTYLITTDGGQYVLRRPPFGRKAKTAHDMGREYRVLKALKPLFPYCPAPLLYCEDESVIGSPFFIMERLSGIILRKDPPPGLTLTAFQARALCERLVEVLVELHQVEWQGNDLKTIGKPQGYVARQVEGWSRRYREARTPDAPSCEELMAWLAERMPPESPVVSVIHNDYRFDNVVLDARDPLRVVGVLDWEMATVGDPLMDLGGGLAYWIDPDDPPEMQAIRLVPTAMDGMMTRKEFVSLYGYLMGVDLGCFDYYYVFGLFRLAAIAQQIYWRYYHGQTRDERFRSLIFAVHVLEKAARKVAEASDR